MSGAKQTKKPSVGLNLFLTLILGLVTAAAIFNSLFEQQFVPPLYLLLATAIIGLFLLISNLHLGFKIKKLTCSSSTTRAEGTGNLSDHASIIINSIGEGVIAIDEKNNISLINPEAKQILGWQDDAVGLNYQTVFRLIDSTRESIPEDLDPVQIVSKTKESQSSREFFVKTHNGKIIPIQLQISPIINTNALIITFRNITLELEEERQQLEFISTASHEMRTPVAAIDGYLGLILNPKICTIDEKALEYARKAQISSKHLGELFKNLLDISKMEDGRIHPRLEVVEVYDFVCQITQSLTSLAHQKNLTLTFAPKEQTEGIKKIHPKIFIQADKNLLTEALFNLIENAIKYTKQGGVTVDVVTDKQEVIISVRDTGTGIPAEDIPHLFQKFYRVDNRDTREINGTGLGLYLTRKFIESMRGRIWVESELGKGSSFMIAFSQLDSNQAQILSKSHQVHPNEFPPATQTTPQDTKSTKKPEISSKNSVPNENKPDESTLSIAEIATIPPPATEDIPADNVNSRVISRHTADRLQALGYNTTKFNIIEDPLPPSQSPNPDKNQNITEKA